MKDIVEKIGMKIYGFTDLWNFQGFVVEEVRNETDGDVHVRLRRDERCVLRCPRCGGRMGVNRVEENVARDVACIEKRTWVHYPAIQGRCSSCKEYHTLRPAEIDGSRRATKRLMVMVHTLCIHMPPTAAASFCKVSPATAYRWDRFE